MFWRRKPIEFDPIDDKWQITAQQALEEYGSAINVLLEMNKDKKLATATVMDLINALAILEIEERIRNLENKKE